MQPITRPAAECVKPATWRDEMGGHRLSAEVGDVVSAADELVVKTSADHWRFFDEVIG